jgi:hypothetical protein
MAGLQENPPELSAEEKEEIRQKEYAKIGANAPQIIKAVETWTRELKAQGQLSEDDIKAIQGMSVTGDQVRVLNKLRALSGGGRDIPGREDPGGQLVEQRLEQVAGGLGDQGDVDVGALEGLRRGQRISD